MFYRRLVTAYARLTDAELHDYYELRHLLDTEQARALVFVMGQRRLRR